MHGVCMTTQHLFHVLTMIEHALCQGSNAVVLNMGVSNPVRGHRIMSGGQQMVVEKNNTLS